MKKLNHFTLASFVLIGITLNPLAAQATDANVTTVTVDTISTTTPSVSADYTITFDVLFGVGGLNIHIYPVADDGTVGDSTLSGFSFASTTFTSDSLPTPITSSVNGDTEFSLLWDTAVGSGTYTMTLHDVQNSATEGNYTIGISSTFEATDADFTQSDPFAIATDPCTDITTAELADVAATSFGTNVSVTRGDSTAVATSYELAYATTQAAIDDDTATTVDMTTDTSTIIEELAAKTVYYFQVSALDANNCVVARTSVSATTQRAIAKQRYAKPMVNKITKRTAVTHWVADDFVDTYDLQLWSNTKLLKRFNNLTALKKALTKKQLQSDKLYKVRIRADYTTGETTRWSKFKKFTTK